MGQTTSWGQASGSQAGEGSATGRQSDRRRELGKREEGYEENRENELILVSAVMTDMNWRRLIGDPRLKQGMEIADGRQVCRENEDQWRQVATKRGSWTVQQDAAQQ